MYYLPWYHPVPALVLTHEKSQMSKVAILRNVGGEARFTDEWPAFWRVVRPFSGGVARFSPGGVPLTK